MKLYNELKKTGILLIAILTLSTLSTEVLGDGAMVTGGYDTKIKRTCKASYIGQVIGINYSYNRSTGKMEKYLPIPSTEKVEVSSSIFKARRGCGKSVPNRCRKRARNSLLNCAKAVTQFPNMGVVPNECRVDSIENYPTNMIFDMGRRVCEPLRTRRGMLLTTFPKPYFVHLMLSIDIWGNKGCGKKGLGKTTVIGGQNYPIRGISGEYSYVRFPLKQFTIDCH